MHSASPVSSQSAPELFGVYRHHLALVTHLARAGGRYAGPERTLAAQAMALVARTQPRWFN